MEKRDNSPLCSYLSDNHLGEAEGSTELPKLYNVAKNINTNMP